MIVCEITPAPSLIMIVSQTGDNINYSSLFIVNNAVYFINAAAPPAAQAAPERFWLADSLIRASLNIFYQHVDPFQGLFILRLPVQLIVPRPILP